MPELPEVEIYNRYLQETSLAQPIKSVEVLNAKILDSPVEEFMEVLPGQSFTETQRWGKNLFVSTSQGVMNMHFGMTGNLEYFHQSVETPKYSRVVFQFNNDYALAYVSKRMFGRVSLIPGIEEYVQQKSLADDALNIGQDQFAANVLKKKKNIKAVLLDQSTAAGVGNWIADEILYQARIHPTTPSRDLHQDQVQLIYQHMQDIINTAINTDSIREQLPVHYITKYGRKTTISCPNCGSDIPKTVVAGRGTYACDNCQQ